MVRGQAKSFIRKTVLLTCLGIVLGIFSLPSPVQAQNNVLRIAAVVNDDIISVLDLEQRLRLVALSSNLRLNPQTRQRLLPQILRSLIDERLQYQEASQNGVTATEREINREIKNVAQRNNIPAVQFPGFLARQGIDVDTLRDQLTAQMSWAKYASRRLSRQISIGEEEIDEELARLEDVAGLSQKRVYEIFLGIDNPDRMAEIRSNMERLLSQIRNGANFSSVARSFSESGTAREGGDLGWITPGQLPPELDTALTKLKPGHISSPIRTITGFSLIYVTDERWAGGNPLDTKISIFQLTERLPQDNQETAKQETIAALEDARARLDGCDSLDHFSKNRPNTTIAAVNDIRTGDLSDKIRAAIAPLKTGDISAPVDMGATVAIFAICEKEETGLSLPARETIKERLGNQKLDLIIRRTMRDLRREAFIDIRI